MVRWSRPLQWKPALVIWNVTLLVGKESEEPIQEVLAPLKAPARAVTGMSHSTETSRQTKTCWKYYLTVGWEHLWITMEKLESVTRNSDLNLKSKAL